MNIGKAFKQSLNPFKADQIGPLKNISITKNWTKIRPYAGMVAGAVLGAVTGGAGWAAMASGALTGAATGAAIDTYGNQIRAADAAQRQNQMQQTVAAIEEQKATQQALNERRQSIKKKKRQIIPNYTRGSQFGGGSSVNKEQNIGSIILG